MNKNLVVKFQHKQNPGLWMYLGKYQNSVHSVFEAKMFDKVEMDSAFDDVYCNALWIKSILEL